MNRVLFDQCSPEMQFNQRSMLPHSTKGSSVKKTSFRQHNGVISSSVKKRDPDRSCSAIMAAASPTPSKGFKAVVTTDKKKAKTSHKKKLKTKRNLDPSKK